MVEFGVPKRIVSFVLPTGYTFNLDGSTLYLAVASVFVTPAAGHPMPIGEQLVMMLTLMLTSKGVAAVPRASLVILSGTLVTFGLTAGSGRIDRDCRYLDGHGAHDGQSRRQLPGLEK